jgi:cysteinyl-tRNA synthetase
MHQLDNALKDSAALSSSDALSPIAEKDVPKALANFDLALLDNLSMPRAAASLFALIKCAEKEFKRVSKEEASAAGASYDLTGLDSIQNALEQMDRIFGIFYEVPLGREEQDFAIQDNMPEIDDIVPDEVMDLVTQRAEAKEAKDWALADSLRNRISELGFAVKDVKGGDPVITKVEA